MNFPSTSSLTNLETVRSGFSDELSLAEIDLSTPAQNSYRSMPALSQQQLQLRNTVLIAHEQHGVRSVLVTGTGKGAGATSIASALAVGLSVDQKKEVLLVDANIQQPQLHKFFQLNNTDRLRTSGRENGSLLEMAVVVGTPNLHVIPSGQGGPETIFDAKRFISILPALQEAFDILILDAPPLRLNPYIVMLSAHLNSVILVAEAQRTRIPEVKEIVRELTRAKAKLLGIVLNRHKDDLPPKMKGWL